MNYIYILFNGNVEAYYHCLINMAVSIEIFFCLFFYTHSYKRRSHFLGRVAAWIGILALLIYMLSPLRANISGYWAEIVTTGILYFYFLLVLFSCYEENGSELLMCFCAGIATQIIVGRLFEAIYIICNKDPYNSLSFFPDGFLPLELDWMIYHSLHLLLIYIVSRIFHYDRDGCGNEAFATPVVIFSLIVTLASILLSTYSRPLEQNNQQLASVIRIYSILYGVLILLLRNRSLEQSRMKAELRIAEELLKLERNQYKSVKNDMEIINIKCHDIRHQLDRYAGKLTEKELLELKAAINIYDATMKTGNDILDMILYKMRLHVETKGIQVSCIADGKSLDFVSAPHLYSLLNNALNNSIDAVEKIKDPDMRVITINIGEENGFLGIHLVNYFDSVCTFEDGLPKTTSPEDGCHHGYGTKSMRYIVELYSGTINFSTEDNIFYLDILIPIPNDHL